MPGPSGNESRQTRYPIRMFACALALALLAPSRELAYVDDHAVIRWRANHQEVALFGANYCLPSALDYRAAGYVSADRKAMVRDDMAHFARMGFDGLRLSFWGDWENADHDGNLRPNDHLDLMDYVIAEGARRGIKFMLSPIVTYDARWPEMKDYPEVADAMSRSFDKGRLGTDPAAIRAQQNYLRQLLDHVNPYTRIALKDDPRIVFVEMINEPWHHPEDRAGSIDYVNALVQAVRDTGCQKLTFHNLSQDFRMAGPINESRVDGATYAWYPTGLNSDHQLQGNFLRYLDDYPPMTRSEVHQKPVLVYEFDLPDTVTSYGYPAMVRTFRQTGAQFAAMFSYDMLATARENLGWTTHLLNLVYTPRKAAGAIIAGEAMRRLPRMKSFGGYPANQSFGDFHVDGHANLAVLNAADAFMNAGETTARPKSPKTLQRIVGYQSSPLVRYPGQGLYFLDRIDDARWRLEIFPDALQVADPFHAPRRGEAKFRLVSRPWPMRISLPGFSTFTVTGLDHPFSARAVDETFTVRPGVYLISRAPSRRPLPATVHGIPLREHATPPLTDRQTYVTLNAPRESHAGETLHLIAQVASDQPPRTVTLTANGKSWPMRPAGPYRYAVDLRPSAGKLDVTAIADSVRTAVQTIDIVSEGSDLFKPSRDAANVAMSRSGESRNGPPALVPGLDADHPAFSLQIPTWLKAPQEDFTASSYLGGLCRRGKKLALRLRSKDRPLPLHVTLVDQDGYAWGVKIAATPEWSLVEVPISDLVLTRWAMLPQAFPGTWSYWRESAPSARLDLTKIERLQMSLRSEDGARPGDQILIQSVRLDP